MGFKDWLDNAEELVERLAPAVKIIANSVASLIAAGLYILIQLISIIGSKGGFILSLINESLTPRQKLALISVLVFSA